MKGRLLTLPELSLVLFVLRENPAAEKFLTWLPTTEVHDLADGGMGSLRFVSDKEGRRLGRKIAETQFLDEDGVPVLVSLYLDQEGALYELDSWKTDYSPLKRIPLF
ncbi:DUF6984 family protein [Hymenobacter crusticola]|uniref:DUF6984 domain-containing protein n=1 Tax=Hymenobacter crusticola TaxID=1770526 RepID=A0A243WIW0_9BACT|nr:hypothetical protein [Hymenobacter crusticola]OUJ74939.1 hypothetical protein BXP70_09340 [Hymenobacter crusticola]